MQNSKLVQLLKVLDEAELKRLLPFLESPFFNRNPAVVRLYRLLQREHPSFDSSKLNKDRVFKKLFPDRSYNHQKLLNLMTDFTALLNRYLSLLQLEKNEAIQNRLLVEAFAERPHSYPVFVKEVQKVHRRLDAAPYRNAVFFQQKYWLHQQLLNHPATDKFGLSRTQYEDAMQQLDRWIILEKLLLSCEMKAREQPLSEKYEIWLFSEVRKEACRFPVKDLITEVYLTILDLLEKGEASIYFHLKALFMDNLSQFTSLQRQNIIQCLINYTIQQGNQGADQFLKENLELYQFGLDKALFLVHGMLNDMIYLSIVNIALRTGTSQWCLHFIESYEQYLELPARNDAKSLALALWYYADHKPDAAIDLLKELDFLNVYYQIQARVLLIKIYFEAFLADEMYRNLVLSQSASFERYLRRNGKIDKSREKALLNFTSSVKRLAKFKTETALHKSGTAKIRQELQQLEPLYNRSWLLRQLDLVMGEAI